MNQLPDHLLCEILINLPTKDMVKTSLVSRRWRHLWKYVPRLDLVIKGSSDLASYDFLTRLLNSNLCLERVKLCFSRIQDNTRNVTLINALMIRRNIQHLVLKGETNRFNIPYHPFYEPFKVEKLEIPPTIYTSCERLVSLRLCGAILPKPTPESVSLPCLKIMELEKIQFLDSLTMEMLISACPVLETLTMDEMYGARVLSPSLLSFSLIRNIYDGGFEKAQVVMETPRLKYLKLSGRIERIMIKDLSSIVELGLDILNIYGDQNITSLRTLISCARDLVMSFHTLLVMLMLSRLDSLPQFYKLTNLRVNGMVFGAWQYLLPFLKSCPNLKSLSMMELKLQRDISDMQRRLCTSNLFDVPQCLLSSLEFVEVKACSLTVDTKKLRRYFIKKSTVLKRFKLTTFRSHKRKALM